MSSHNSSLKAILYAFLANLGIALAKSWAAFYTGSGSMLAEAIHSYADTGNQVLLYIGLKQSQKPADEKHPLGYGKASYFWSFIVAVMLFSMGGLFSIYEGWHKLHAPEELHQPWVALVVLAFSIVLEGLSLMGAMREIHAVRGEKSFREWVSTTRQAELMVVFGEDSAAILGLILAFIFVSLAIVTGNPIFDAVGSICIGIVLIFVSIFIATRLKGLILGRGVEPEVKAALDEFIEENDAIEDVLNIITMHMGPQVMLAAKLRMRSDLCIEDAVREINALEVKIKQRFPEIGWCFMEPDNKV
ncbi:MAG: cation diffusion facilitator family transporter [Pseudomonadota bacterium]|nr:cation diffusion facilitator family transporter [Pseudomonadota bacterium]